MWHLFTVFSLQYANIAHKFMSQAEVLITIAYRETMIKA